ncbi:Type I restriction-modification system specificity subunit S [Lactiplantibacillus plantarum]|nr:Type I restriction-modification system specificity subunit S [Lactiplantibacillus plantarum]
MQSTLSIFKIDSLIAANEDKLNQLKKLKKYLMQNMFV